MKYHLAAAISVIIEQFIKIVPSYRFVIKFVNTELIDVYIS